MRDDLARQGTPRSIPFRSGKAAWLFTAMIGLAVSGCETNFGSPSDEELAGVEIKTVHPADLDEAVASQKGRVVLVDYWATWCGPCCQLFPHNVDLERQFARDGLSLVTVSLDGTANERKVRRFLLRNRAAGMNYLANDGENFDIGEAIPLVRIYDRQGKLRDTVVGVNEPRIDSMVRTLLSEGPTP